MTAAMRRMEDKLGQTPALSPGARVLDAGCGEGDVAVRLGTRFGLEVDGVDLLEANLRRARARRPAPPPRAAWLTPAAACTTPGVAG
jgi:ubiquinone/menaquinone biosynthesis C-methylase UbiE